MKMMKLFLIVAVLLSAVTMVAGAEKEGMKTVVYTADLHCVSCKAKVEKNIPYEKGVKDLKVDMDAKTITVTFREDKNTTEGIKKAIEKLKIEVTGVSDKAVACEKKCEDKGKKCESECPKDGKKDDCCKDKKK